MKTRTAAYDAAWGNRHVQRERYYATIARRYWNGAAYVLATPISIPQREIENIRGLSTKFDLPLQNRILPAQVSLLLIDKGYKWLPSNTASGKWRRDATAILGYDPVGSEVVLYHGLDLADGTTEYLAQFTGIIQDDPTFDSTSGIATIALLERAAAKLENARASNVCVTGTGHATYPTNGNGIILAFSAVIMSVWEMTVIAWNSITRTLGTDYTIDDLNDAEVAPTINFEAASVPGAYPITYSYKQWHRNKSIAELVGLLCDEAGIASDDREIDDVQFEGGAAGSATIDSQANWEAGTVLTNIDTAGLPGDIRRKWSLVSDCSDFSFFSSKTTDMIVSGGKITTDNGVGYTGHATGTFTKAYGTWEAEIYCSTYVAMWGFILKSDGGTSYKVVVTPTNISLVRTAAGGGNWNDMSPAATLITSARTSVNGDKVRVTRAANGDFSLYVNGTQIGATVNDTTITTSDYMSLSGAGYPDSSYSMFTFDNVYYSESVQASGSATNAASVWESAAQDVLSTPTSWGTLDTTETLNGGTIAYATASSTDGASWDAYVDISGSGAIQSALKRYLKVRVTFTPAASTWTSPIVSKLIARFMTANLFILSADFTGMTCAQAIQEFAKMGGMEFGSKGDGTFYFRNRVVSGDADMELSQKNAIIAVTKYATGYKDVRPIAVVRYGKSGTDGYYNVEYGATQAGEASPTTAARFGNRTIELDLNRFIFANSATVATAIATKLYTMNYRPKRKITIRCRLIAHLDASDKLSISFHDSPLIEKAIFGDPFLKGFPPLGPNPKTLARDILMKVVGHSPDIMKSESVIDLEEVLS